MGATEGRVAAGVERAPREEAGLTVAPALRRRLLLLLAFGAVYLFWGSTYLAIRVGVQTIPPALMVGLRFLVAGLLLLPVARALGQPLTVSARDLRALFLIGLLLLVGGNGGVVWAEQYVASGLAALLVATIPLWMVSLEALLPGGSRLTVAAATGLTVGFLGVAVLLWPKLQGMQGQTSGGRRPSCSPPSLGPWAPSGRGAPASQSRRWWRRGGRCSWSAPS